MCYGNKLRLNHTFSGLFHSTFQFIVLAISMIICPIVAVTQSQTSRAVDEKTQILRQGTPLQQMSILDGLASNVEADKAIDQRFAEVVERLAAADGNAAVSLRSATLLRYEKRYYSTILPILNTGLTSPDQLAAGPMMQDVISAIGIVATVARTDSRLDLLNELQRSRHLLENSGLKHHESVVDTLQTTISVLESDYRLIAVKRVKYWVDNYQNLLIIIGLFVTWLFILVFLFIFFPSWIVAINTILRPIRVEFPAQLGGIKIGLASPLLVRSLSKSTRAMDAWVGKHAQDVRENLEKVIENQGSKFEFVALPIICNGSACPGLTYEIASRLVRTDTGRILVWGAIGTGKTAIVARFARWAMALEKSCRLNNHYMIPIIFDSEVSWRENSHAPILLDEIQRKLQALTQTTATQEITQDLLAGGRLILLFDQFSELPEKDRALLRPDSGLVPVGVPLVVASREREIFDGMPMALINTLELGLDESFRFIDHASDQAAGKNFIVKAKNQIKNVLGTNNVPIGFVSELLHYLKSCAFSNTDTFYLSHFVIMHLKRKQEKLSNIKPQSLNIVEQRDFRDVFIDVVALATCALTDDFEIEQVSIDNAVSCLENLDAQFAMQRLQYLETQLAIIETSQTKSLINFPVRSLAMQLAAIGTANGLANDRNQWLELLTRISEKGRKSMASPEFGIALADAVLAGEVGNIVPSDIQKKLSGLLADGQRALRI